MKRMNAISSLFLVLGLCVWGIAAADDRDDHGDWGSWGERGDALVLGDSVAFSYINGVGYEYVNPANFIGFPLRLHEWLDLHVVDAGCPGETTGSFLSSTAPDNGCRAYRANFPLHVPYRGTQLEFALAFLRTHRDTRLVTVTLGANDGFLAEAACAAYANTDGYLDCLAPKLQSVATNIATILAELRGAGYDGRIVVTNYYSTDYSDAPATYLTGVLNQLIEAPLQAYRAVLADLFTAFESAVPTTGTNTTCRAGLLNVSGPVVPASTPPSYICDIHPSQSGHLLIAQAIAKAYETARR
jgi:lysophospholipase L1-like esterase